MGQDHGMRICGDESCNCWMTGVSGNLPMAITPHPLAPAARRNWFATTHWSLVVSAGHGSDPDRSRMAMERLCESYWLPLYSYVRSRGYSPEDAQDLVQEFFARLLKQNRVAKANREKGKFRSFLLSSLKNFLSDEWDKSRAQKRGGGYLPLSLQFDQGEAVYEIEPVNHITPEQIFERRWALTLLEKVMVNLEDEYLKSHRGELYRALSSCLVGERTAQPYDELSVAHNMTVSAVKSAVHRLRSRYRELLRREIANTVSTPEEVDEELRYLFEVLERR